MHTREDVVSIASQQRVIDEQNAKIRTLRQQLAQAKANERDAQQVYDDLVDLCDEHEVAGMSVIPVTRLRQIRPKGHGLSS